MTNPLGIMAYPFTLSNCRYLLNSPHQHRHTVTTTRWGLLIISSGRNKLPCQLSTWFHIGLSCSDLFFSHPCILIYHVMCLIITVVNALQGIVVILYHSVIFYVEILTPPPYFLFMYNKLVRNTRGIKYYKWFHVIVKYLNHFGDKVILRNIEGHLVKVMPDHTYYKFL